MDIDKEGKSTAESLRATRTYGKFRCHNPTCMERLEPKKGDKTIKCPTCGMEFRVAWVKDGLPTIRGRDAYLLYNHTKQGCDPIGPDNTLMVSGGILCATLASATSRCHVMAKSPLTGLLGSCNMGGFFSPEMAWAGFHHLVIKGKAKHPVYIYIHNGEIEIRDARDIWGLSVTETQWAIRDKLGDQEVKSMVWGPAGGTRGTYANVMTGIKNSGGRTGMGCVMGSKNLKAVS